ncbi:MAG: trigger factor [Gemmatimonadetes bacterium]|nr:trigger factor [Gemmatimonadota bacterium]
MTVATPTIRITPTGDEPGARSLKVEVPPERVHEAQAKATSYYTRQARLPGFRAGKAPAELVRKRYRDQIRESALRELIDESWKAALEQESLKPLTEPHIHHLKFDDGAPLTFEFHVEVRPEITLERAGGFTLTRTAQPVTDELVTTQIEELRRQKAPWVPAAAEAAKPQPGELVRLTLATLENGEPKDPQQHEIVLGEGRAIPELEEHILRLAPGESADADIRFPDDFPEEAKRGQVRSVRLSVHEVKRRELPELGDAFAREIGDFESFDDLRKAVRQDMELDAAREADADVRRQVIEQIVAANTVPAPRSLVERVLAAFARAYEIPETELQKFANEFAPIAEAQVRRDLVLDHVAESNGLRATEQEVDERVAELAARRKIEPGQLYASLQKANRLRELERTITEEKVFAHLLSQSTVTDT